MRGRLCLLWCLIATVTASVPALAAGTRPAFKVTEWASRSLTDGVPAESVVHLQARPTANTIGTFETARACGRSPRRRG